jgi:hypothetical protein
MRGVEMTAPPVATEDAATTARRLAGLLLDEVVPGGLGI